LQSRRQETKLLQQEKSACSAFCSSFSSHSFSCCPPSDLRIHSTVQKICYEISCKHNRRSNHCYSKKQRQVTPKPGSHRGLSEPRIGKHLLHKYRAPDNFAD